MTELPAGTAKSTFYFSGAVDEVRVWSGVRSRSQILSDMFDTIAPAAAAATSDLRLYLTCYDAVDSATVRDVTGAFFASLQPAGLVGGIPTFFSVPVDISNPLAANFFSSAMDRPATVRLLFGQQLVTIPPSGNISGSNFFVLEMLKANSIFISVIDPNPSDTAVIGNPSFYPSVGGLPNGAALQPQVTSASAYSTLALEGVVFARTLSWVPSFESDWLIPLGGLPVSVPLNEVASNPLDPTAALPARARNDVIVLKLYVSAPPEFMSGPPLNSLLEAELDAFIGLQVSFEVRARDRNKEEALLLQVAYDPGLPNFAFVSPPSSDGVGSVLVTRSFAWTPTCMQARKHYIVFEAAAGGSKSQQRVTINVLVPAPVLIAFDSSLLISAPGCTVAMTLNAADASMQARALGLASYRQVFSYNLSDVTAGQLPLALPRSELVAAAGINAFGGNSAALRIFPEFVHGGRTYLACVTVSDACGIAAAAQYTRCRRILVESCKICAGQGATLTSLASLFGTDASSLYAVNSMLPNPDLVILNSVVAIGGTHYSAQGDTLAAVAETFQTSVDMLRRGNPSFAAVNANTTLSVGTAVCIISRVCELEQQCASSGGGSCPSGR